jgi:hypothetical protein
VVVPDGEARATSLPERAEAAAHALADGLQRLEAVGAEAAWMPTQSALQWSMAMNTAAWPSPVTVVVRSVPHIASTVSGMMVPSWLRWATGRAGPRGGEQVVFAHQPQHAPLRGPHAAVAQPGPDLAVPLAVERAGGERGADRRHEAASGIGPTGPGRRGGASRGGARCR